MGVNPGQFGRVRRLGADMLCEVCSQSIDQTLAEFTQEEGKADEIP